MDTLNFAKETRFNLFKTHLIGLHFETLDLRSHNRCKVFALLILWVIDAEVQQELM